MPRWLSVALGLGVVLLAVALMAKGMVVHHTPPQSSAATPELAPGGSGSATNHEADAQAAFDPSAILMPEARTVPGSGAPAVPLPDKAPMQVRFGVVLVTYAGAQGAGDHARTQHDAHELADKLGADAKSDFHGAVVRGDTGSIDDAGRMPRGVLEPGIEYVLFTLPAGGVSEPIDTPRGFWIVKRLE
jgi:hypothetical protein